MTRVTEVDVLAERLKSWTPRELHKRLHQIYGQVDGYGHLTASQSVKDEVARLSAELERRGYDWVAHLVVNERIIGFGWLPWFYQRTDA